MLSFPFNSSSMVMWINKDALKKANVEIPKTWPEVFEAAKKLKAAGSATCGFSSAWTTWAMIEQFSAWHNVPLATKANGLDGFDTELKINSPLHVKHLQSLVDLQKDKTYDYSGRASASEGRFTSGECPIFLTSSGFYGNVKANAKFEFTSVPMPYYPGRRRRSAELDHRRRFPVGDGRQEAGRIQGRREVLQPSCPTPTARRSCTRNRATCRSPRRPTRRRRPPASTRRTRSCRRRSLELTNKEPTENSRGLRLGNMVADARRLVGGDRSALGGPEVGARTPSTPPSAAATSSCASSSGPLHAERISANAIPRAAPPPGLSRYPADHAPPEPSST